MEVVESVGGLGVGDGVAVGAGVELLGDAVELDALGEEAVLGVAAEGVPSGGDVVAQVVEGGGDGGLVDDVAVDPAATGGAEGEDVGSAGRVLGQFWLQSDGDSVQDFLSFHSYQAVAGKFRPGFWLGQCSPV